MAYDNSDGRLRGRKLQQRRLRIWSQSPYCAMCKKLTDGTSGPNGFQIDHIIRLDQGGLDTEDNWQLLCLPCHAIKTAQEAGTAVAAVNYPEWIKRAACKVTVVCGPPGSGKNWHVDRRRHPSDEVIDLDVIMSQLSGLPIYQYGKEWLNAAVRLRNRRLADLWRESPSHHVWLITGAAGNSRREWWADKLGTKEIVLLDAPYVTCAARIKQDARRRPRQHEHMEAAAKWWRVERSLSGPSRRAEFDSDGRVAW